MFMAFLIFGSWNAASFYRMLGEVNAQRDPRHQFGYLWFSPLKWWRVLSLHRQMYPQRWSRVINVVPLALWLLLIVVAAYYFR
jgi:hypothetical protein